MRIIIQVAQILRGLVAAVLLLPLTTIGQDFLVSGIEIDADATTEQIEAAIVAIRARDSLENEVRESAIEQLRLAQAQVQSRRAAESAAAEYAESIKTAPQETTVLRAALGDPLPPLPTRESLGVDDSTSLAELEQLLALEMAERASIDSGLSTMQTESDAQTGRPAIARARIEQLRRLIQEDDASDGPLAGNEEPAILTALRGLNAALVRATRLAEIEKLEQESLSQAFRLQLLQARQSTATRQRVSVQRRIELLRSLINEGRTAVALSAQEATAESALLAADSHPVILEFAEGNADLTQRLLDNASRLQVLDQELVGIRSETESIELRLSRSQQRLEIGGLSRVIGRLLIEERRNLPQFASYTRQIDRRSDQLAEVGLALVDIQEQRRDHALIDERVRDLMTGIAGEHADATDMSGIGDDIRTLLQSRRDLLTKAESSYRSYLRILGDIDVSQRRQLELVEEYRVFLDQNVLWIPSADIAFKGEWRGEIVAAAALLSPTVWSTAATELMASVAEHVPQAAAFLILLLLLLLARRPANHYEQHVVSRVGRLSTDHIGLTLTSLIIAVIRVAPIPLMVIATAWLLTNSPQLSPYSENIASSVAALGPFLFNAMFFRELSARGGLFRVHFGWHDDSLDVLRRQLSLLVYVGAPLLLVTGILFESSATSEHAMLGRWVFVVLMAFLTFVIHSLAHPHSPNIARYLKRRPPGSWANHLRWFWYGLVVGAPLFLAVLAIFGYMYAAANLADSLVRTAWVGLGLGVVNLLILRWLALAQRRMAFRIALQKREAVRAERETESQPGAEAEIPPPEPEALDLEKVDKQTKTIIRTGLFFVAAIAIWNIWTDLLPAFTLLERIDLWSQTVTVDGVASIEPVTLADLLMAVLIAIVTAVGAQNLPGLMEVMIPRRLAREPGSRYTITTLVRYTIIMIGVISVLSIVGWNWSQIQWLVAALSVGLGFGLQEIVANFVSGLVILFERPVRIGDTVTVGQLTGTVSRVHIRATTITDWDRKEIIVPNKAFITEQVVNWTLSDPITRIQIPVGVAYGSDVALVHKTMQKTIEELPLVLEEPAPSVFFSGFGDSALEFTLHVYLRQMTDRMPMIHAVHEAVFAALRENGIEIPFPQRDLHIRSTVEHKD